LFRVPLDSGGYDNGGAYWGIDIPLWFCLDDNGDMIASERAYSRAEAFQKITKHSGCGEIRLAKGVKE
jgi:hypothetical protein